MPIVGLGALPDWKRRREGLRITLLGIVIQEVNAITGMDLIRRAVAPHASTV